MWLIQECRICDATLDTGSADLCPIQTLAVYSGDICLINAATCCDFTTDSCQVLICDCGEVRCASGGYVSFRRVGDCVTMIPAFQLLASEKGFDGYQYGPPKYLVMGRQCGAVFDPAVYSTVRTRIPELPPVSQLPPLSAYEAIALAQSEAPFDVLGRFPHLPSLNKTLILAVTEGETETEIRALDNFLSAARDPHAIAAVVPQPNRCSPIEFHLDAAGFPAWIGFARYDRQIGVFLEPLGVLVIQS